MRVGINLHREESERKRLSVVILTVILSVITRSNEGDKRKVEV